MSSAIQPSLADPDKLGLLIQCRHKMDQLNTNQLLQYTNLICQILSPVQLKNLLFVGLNSTQNNISFEQLFEIRSSINEIIEESKSKSKIASVSNDNKRSNSEIITIPKNASFSKVIPFDIISNCICKFLTMSSITKLARCDRKLAIICHTPTSIQNLMHRFDYYPYTTSYGIITDGYYNDMNNWTVSNTHRLKNINKLSIHIDFVEDKLEIFNTFENVTDLCLYAEENFSEQWCLWQWKDMKLLPMLQNIAFINVYQIIFVLSFLERYKDTPGTADFYNQIIYKLKSIAIVDCKWSSVGDWVEHNDIDNKTQPYKRYKNIIKFLLPSQPNMLQTLKLENSYLLKTVHPECKDSNDEFEDIQRIKTSLNNLHGFVYGEPDFDYGQSQNLFLCLTRNILLNIISFKKLESIHIHSIYDDLISIFINDTNINRLNNISELCVSIDMSFDKTSPLLSLKKRFPKLRKLCLVVNITESDDASEIVENFEQLMTSVLKANKKLTLFQIVTVITSEFCIKTMNIVGELCKKLVNSFNSILNDWNYSRSYSKQPLLFKFHIKLCHSTFLPECTGLDGVSSELFANLIQNMITKFLIVYPFGKTQLKLSYDAQNHYYILRKLGYCLKGLDGLFKVNIKEGGSLKHLKDDSYFDIESWTCCNDMDYKQYAISAVKKRFNSKSVHHGRKWKVDCRYCCNTPWV
eukprot:414497_1